MNILKLLIVLVILSFISACSSTTTSSRGEIKTEKPASAMAAESYRVKTEDKKFNVVVSTTEKNTLEVPATIEHIVYFDFDKSIIRPEARVILIAQAAHLMESSARVLLEGHCDERGTRKYNQALGERRAKAVEDFLINEGVKPDQLSMISYGEDRPADPRHNEEAWAKNRRVEIK